MPGGGADGAFERIVSRSAASERARGVPCMVTTVISYTFGIKQEVLESATWSDHGKAQFLEVLRRFVAGYHADMVLGCAVGGHKRGLTQDQMDGLKEDVLALEFCQNYTLALKRQDEVIDHLLPFPAKLASGVPCDPQVVISATQRRSGKGLSAVFVVGNLRIRSQHGKLPSIATKQRVVQEALCLLESYAAKVMKSKVPRKTAV